MSGEDAKSTLEMSGEDAKTTLETLGEDTKTLLEMGGEDWKITLVSSVVFLPFPWSLSKYALHGIDRFLKSAGSRSVIRHRDFWKLHSFRVYFYIFSTRFECTFTSSPLVWSVFFNRIILVNVYQQLSILLSIHKRRFTLRPFPYNFTLVSSVVLNLLHSFRV